ncbi:hypothetical protein AC626_20910 [Pseudoalteromonas rubra]|uniref:Uncharacterized protein n=1 Tax=Pseudoalteromonas rubra TaxID=43658 RepID=A0A0L0EMU5_9GAMM|nr:hypothetical protein AC626_20910 [Pseudoalteromonas rubra]
MNNKHSLICAISLLLAHPLALADTSASVSANVAASSNYFWRGSPNRMMAPPSLAGWTMTAGKDFILEPGHPT